jgi:hypothetical protein
MLRATPPGEDGVTRTRTRGFDDDDDTKTKTKVARAERGYTEDDGEDWDPEDDEIPFDEQPEDGEFLQMVYEADQQALQYVTQVNRTSWERGYKAYHQEHFEGSKYRSTDYNNRSRLFVRRRARRCARTWRPRRHRCSDRWMRSIAGRATRPIRCSAAPLRCSRNW